jgi:hypothetical protein
MKNNADQTLEKAMEDFEYVCDKPTIKNTTTTKKMTTSKKKIYNFWPLLFIFLLLMPIVDTLQYKLQPITDFSNIIITRMDKALPITTYEEPIVHPKEYNCIKALKTSNEQLSFMKNELKLVNNKLSLANKQPSKKEVDYILCGNVAIGYGLDFHKKQYLLCSNFEGIIPVNKTSPTTPHIISCPPWRHLVGIYNETSLMCNIKQRKEHKKPSFYCEHGIKGIIIHNNTLLKPICRKISYTEDYLLL